MSAQLKQLFTGNEGKLLRSLLTPSWLSGLLAVTASVAIVIGVIIALNYNGSSLQQLVGLRNSSTSTDTSVSNTYQTLDENFSSNTTVSDIPLFIFWAGVGLVVYPFANSILRAFRGALDLEAEIHYVNANRNSLLKEAAEHLATRLLVLVAWVLLLRYSLHVLLPYAIALTRVGITSTSSIVGSEYIVSALVISTVVLHLHTILLRLLLLKPRVFWQSSYN